MSGAGRPTVHEIVGGFCRICGDTAEWLVERSGDHVVYLTQGEDDADQAP